MAVYYCCSECSQINEYNVASNGVKINLTENENWMKIDTFVKLWLRPSDHK